MNACCAARRPTCYPWRIVEGLDHVLPVAERDLGAKAAFLADPGLACFTTPHFEGYSAVLHRLRDIESVDEERLAALLRHAWETRAPTGVLSTGSTALVRTAS